MTTPPRSRATAARSPAPPLLRRQRRLPLPRPGVRGAALRARRRARRRLAADRVRRADLRGLAAAVAGVRGAGPRGPAPAARLGRGAGADERLLLRWRSTGSPLGHGRGDRVPARDRARRARAPAAPRNVAALALAVPGVYLLCGVQLAAEPLGLAFAFANAVLFALYIVLADRVAKRAAHRRHRRPRRLDADRRRRRHADRRLGGRAGPRATPSRCSRGSASASSSSVIPYVADQLALARLRARDLRADGLAAAGDRHGDRDRRARAGPVAPPSSPA